MLILPMNKSVGLIYYKIYGIIHVCSRVEEYTIHGPAVSDMLLPANLSSTASHTTIRT